MRHAVHLLFERPVDLLHSKAAIGAADRAVGVDADAVALDVGEAVGAAAGVTCRAHDIDAVAAVAAAVPEVVELLRLDATALVDAADEGGGQALADDRGVELLTARDSEFHRTAVGAHGECHSDGLEVDAGLAAKAAAHGGNDDLDVAVRQAKAGAEEVTDGEWALG